MLALRYLTHLILHIVSDGEKGFLELPVVDLSQKVSLVLHGIRTRTKPLPALGIDLGLGIVSCSDEVIVMATLFIEGAELNQTVTHHIWIGCQAGTYLFHRVGRHLIPVFFVTVDDLQLAAVLMRHRRCHLQILLRRAVPLFFLLRSYLDIEAVRMESEFCELIHHHTAVDTARQQHRNPLILYLFTIHCSLFTVHYSLKSESQRRIRCPVSHTP